jgi:hypothetical protein
MKNTKKIIGILPTILLAAVVLSSVMYAETAEACKLLVTLSTKFGGPLKTKGCSSCVCESDNTSKVYTLKQTIKEPLSANTDCDETHKLISARSIFYAEITRTIKITRDRCILGVHEGKFQILDPRGRTLFSGRLSGTEGVKSWEGQPSKKRCCANTTKEFGGGGVLEGKGRINNVTYQLKATYVSIFEFDPTADLCQKDAVHRWTTHIDGALIGKCASVERKPDLTVKNLDVTWDGEKRAKATISNIGTKDAGNFMVYFNGEEDPVSPNRRPQVSHNVPALAKGDSIVLEADFAPLAHPDNNNLGNVKKILVIADPKDTVEELNENNNEAEMPLP